MATIFDINFDLFANELLPPDKRNPENFAMLRGFLEGQRWIHDLLFDSYKVGSTAPKWTPGTYNQYDQVVYNKIVYSSLSNNNTATPTNSTFWEKIQDSFLGVDQRVLFNGSKLIVEYALNNQFGTIFRQPPNQSDIYITNIAAVAIGFLIGNTKGTYVGKTKSSSYVNSSQTFKQINNFTINIPTAAYALTSESAIRDFLTFIPTSINYTITPY